MSKRKDDMFGLNLISGYAPDTFFKPVILISTISSHDAIGDSTAICFGNALNRFHLMEKVFVAKECYERAGWGDPRKDTSEFIVIKKHKNWKLASKFHMKLVESLNWKKYLKLYDKYCPEKLKRDF